MFVFLSKKIAIPNNQRLNCIAWNQKQGYIAVGGEDGLLKVVRAESSNVAAPTTTSDANNSNKTVNRTTTSNSSGNSSNLSMNQTLEGHNGQVQVVTWNEENQKLTSSDQNGVIIVWMLYKGSWYEEMINNRNKSVVKGMSWSQDGQKICIAYEDGAVIVGSVEGHRIWGKELKSVYWTAVKWSPDAKFLLFGSRNGEAHLYDEEGIFVTKLESVGECASQAIVAIDWYDGKHGHVAINCPVLAVCFQNGKVCLMRGITDYNPSFFETGITSVVSCNWNTYGSVLAVAGSIVATNVVQFYSTFGEHLKTLKVPGKELSGCSWEGGSLRVCLSVDSNIFFANIRPNYKYAYIGNTVVFTDDRASKEGVCVTFWETKNNARYFITVNKLIDIDAHGEHCVLVTHYGPNPNDESYLLLVCNAISNPVDIKFLDFEPHRVAINSNTVFIATRSHLLIWNFRVPKMLLYGTGKLRKDRIYHVDDTPTGINEDYQLDPKSLAESQHPKNTNDPICALAVSDQLLLVARDSGIIQQYSFPQMVLSRSYATGRKISKMFINSDSTRVAIIDSQDVLSLLDLTAAIGSGSAKNANRTKNDDADERDKDEDEAEELAKFERKDAWSVRWSDDNPRLVAIFEKSRMYVFRGLEPEEPIASTGYVCSFKDLVIRCIALDELVRRPETARPELITDIEIKSLRDTRELLSKVGWKEAQQFVKDNPHPRLWRLLAEHALLKLDLDAAEFAYVHCANWLEIQFVKRLRGIHDDGLRKAEVLARLGSFDEAEQAYLELDRRDLAISLRLKLADFERAIQLMHLGGVTSDVQLENAHARWGEQLAYQQKWQEAREHLEKGRSIEKLLECHYRLSNYDCLASVASQIADHAPELQQAAKLLAAAGLIQEAVACYVRSGEARQAVDLCVRQNRWGQALELARTWKLPGIGELLGKYARHLLTSGRRLQAVELYRKADCPLEAAKLMLEFAAEQAKKKAPPLRLKKLYVLAALLVQEHLEAAQSKTSVRSGLLLGLSEATGEDARIVQEAWRGAEAYHFLLMAHRQLYAGEPESALRTALRLREYEDLLEHEPIYALLALASCACRSLATCSRALARLESIDPRYEELSLELFGKRSPRDARPPPKAECLQCESFVPDYCVVCPNCSSSFPACVVTGRPLMDQSTAWLCTVCKHRATSEREVVNINSCPLCHSPITYM